MKLIYYGQSKTLTEYLKIFPKFSTTDFYNQKYKYIVIAGISLLPDRRKVLTEEERDHLKSLQSTSNKSRLNSQ